MSVQAIKADGDFCPVDSYRNGGAWVSSEETNIAHTFAREIAKLRGERRYFESAYDEVEHYHYQMFPGGFER